jgi:hypothetical protein
VCGWWGLLEGSKSPIEQDVADRCGSLYVDGWCRLRPVRSRVWENEAEMPDAVSAEKWEKKPNLIRLLPIDLHLVAACAGMGVLVATLAWDDLGSLQLAIRGRQTGTLYGATQGVSF